MVPQASKGVWMFPVWRKERSVGHSLWDGGEHAYFILLARSMLFLACFLFFSLGLCQILRFCVSQVWLCWHKVPVLNRYLFSVVLFFMFLYFSPQAVRGSAFRPAHQKVENCLCFWEEWVDKRSPLEDLFSSQLFLPFVFLLSCFSFISSSIFLPFMTLWKDY